MTKIIGWSAKFFIALLVISVLVWGFLGYFVTNQNADGQTTDGLGRVLVITPAVLRIFFGEERFYPGFGWFVFDTLSFFGSVGIIVLLVKAAAVWSGEEEKKK